MQRVNQIGIIGAGASGCICTYFLLKAGFEVTVFDYGTPLRTLLPTGGGRCNLAHAEYDFKDLVKNYPRGEKFLYSVFSKFSTYDSLALFDEIGVKTYTQENGRIFPISNSSKDVQEKILNSIKQANFIREKVKKITKLNNGYKITTNKAEYFFSEIVIATGGGIKNTAIEGLEHKIIEYKPALVGLNTDIKNLSGIVLKNVYSRDCNIKDDILFTHFGVSGPLIYKISSIKANDKLPYNLTFDLFTENFDLQEMLNKNPHKKFKNILSILFPERFAEFIAGEHSEIEGWKIDSKIKNLILSKIHNFKLIITGTNKGDETVTAGGYDLNEINSKTMESKIYPSLYIIGEALNIDGFCGGFNLQNAWSTAFVAADSIINKVP